MASSIANNYFSKSIHLKSFIYTSFLMILSSLLYIIISFWTFPLVSKESYIVLYLIVFIPIYLRFFVTLYSKKIYSNPLFISTDLPDGMITDDLIISLFSTGSNLFNEQIPYKLANHLEPPCKTIYNHVANYYIYVYQNIHKKNAQLPESLYSTSTFPIELFRSLFFSSLPSILSFHKDSLYSSYYIILSSTINDLYHQKLLLSLPLEKLPYVQSNSVLYPYMNTTDYIQCTDLCLWNIHNLTLSIYMNQSNYPDLGAYSYLGRKEDTLFTAIENNIYLILSSLPPLYGLVFPPDVVNFITIFKKRNLL
ncbi:hypothetical protein WA158_007827 [Blastocystis sp. Blastoise]